MYVLVDYDNLKQVSPRDLKEAAERIAQVFIPLLDMVPTRIELRLYGGWFEEDKPTIDCQDLQAEIGLDFSRPIGISTSNGVKRSIWAAELAKALLCDPGRDLFHTFRRRGSAFRGIRWSDPANHGCGEGEACPLRGYKRIAKNERAVCSRSGCQVECDRVISRPEQKLVDTMLTADAIYLAHRREPGIVLVTADDDLWPAIRQALLMGTSVYHVRPRVTNWTPQSYTAGLAYLFTVPRPTRAAEPILSC